MLSSILKKLSNNSVQFFVIHTVITVACSAAMLRVTSQLNALNFIIGQFYVWVSLTSISLAVYLFFLKKNIALLVGVIVFKWPILIYVVFKLAESVSVSPVYLALGFLPVLLSALIWSVFQKE